MTTKLWISDKLELRWNKWPEKEFWPEGTEKYEDNARALAQAKAESLPLVPNYAGEMQERIGSMDLKSDTFIEYAGEVEVINQHKYSDEYPWEDIPAGKAADVITWHTRLRKVARLKPVNSAMSFTDGMDPGVGQYYEKAHGLEPVLIGAGPPEIASLKARILKAFNRKISMGEAHWEIDREMKQSLAEVLDELGIK